MKRHGFTIWEAIAALAVLCVIAMLFLPVFSKNAEIDPPPPQCQSNLKQIALGIRQYREDYDDQYPIAKNSNSDWTSRNNWIGQLKPYVPSAKLYHCDQEQIPENSQMSSYGYNARLSKRRQNSVPVSVMVVLNFEVIAESNNHTQTGISPAAVTAATRHKDGANYSFADGHVRWYQVGAVTALFPTQNQPTFNIR